MDGSLLFAPAADSGLLKLSKLTAKFKRRYIVIASGEEGYTLSIYKTRPRGGKPDPTLTFSMLRFASAYIADDKPQTLVVTAKDSFPLAPSASSSPANVLRLARSSRLPSYSSNLGSSPILMFRNDPDVPNQLDSWQRFITNALKTPPSPPTIPIIAPPVQPQAGIVDAALSRLGPSVAHLSVSIPSSTAAFSPFDGHTIRPFQSNSRGWDAQSASTTTSSHFGALPITEDSLPDSPVAACSPVVATSPIEKLDTSHLSILDRALRQKQERQSASSITGILDKHASMPPEGFSASNQQCRPFARRNTSASTTVSSIRGHRDQGLTKTPVSLTKTSTASTIFSPGPTAGNKGSSSAEIRDLRRSSIISFINPTTVGGTGSKRNSLNGSRPSTSSNDTETLLLALKNRCLYSERDQEDSISIGRRSVHIQPSRNGSVSPVLQA